MKIYNKIKIVILLFLIVQANVFADSKVDILLGGTEVSFKYTSELLSRALKIEGYTANISYIGDLPTPRLESMLLNGEISCFILGKTDERNQHFLPIDIGMTNNLFGQRILFIEPGTQQDYDQVITLADFQQLGKTAGMGESWGDVAIWQKNKLLVTTIGGNWRNLYKMVAAGNRGIDYLSRGAQEIVVEYQQHPELEVEASLVLVYERDHILYVSPKRPELHKLLSEVMIAAEEAGLIKQVSKEFYPEVYQPPINLDQRRIIQLELANSQ